MSTEPRHCTPGLASRNARICQPNGATQIFVQPRHSTNPCQHSARAPAPPPSFAGQLLEIFNIVQDGPSGRLQAYVDIAIRDAL